MGHLIDRLAGHGDVPELTWVLIDAAGIEGGQAGLPWAHCARLECLFTGDLADELADVGPYLGAITDWNEETELVFSELLAGGIALLLSPADPAVPFEDIHRHFRKFNVVYGPDGGPLFFRYYDPRALMPVLEVLEPAQRATFMAPFERLLISDSSGQILNVPALRQGGEI